MGQAGEMLREDLDRFAHNVKGAKVEKKGNVTHVTMPSSSFGKLTKAEENLLDVFDDEDDPHGPY